MASGVPIQQGGAPVGAQQRVGVLHQFGQGFVRLSAAAVQVLLYLGLAVQVVELGPIRLRIGQRIVAYHHSRCLHQAGFNGVVQAEVAHHPGEQAFFVIGLSGGRKGCGRQVEAALDAARLVDAVQPFDPARGLVQVDAQFSRLRLADLDVGWLAVGVVGLIVDDHDVPALRQLAQHPLGEHLVGLLALLHHRAVGLLQRHEGVPVFHQDFGLVELAAQRVRRAGGELVVGVARLAGVQHLEPALDGQARRHDEHGAREVLVPLRVGDGVEHLPGDEHRHHRGLARTGGHLVAHALERAPIALQEHALPV